MHGQCDIDSDGRRQVESDATLWAIKMDLNSDWNATSKFEVSAGPKGQEQSMSRILGNFAKTFIRLSEKIATKHNGNGRGDR